MLFDKLAIDIAQSTYMTVLARFRKIRNGKLELLALKEKFSGKDVWENIIKDDENFLENRKWTGTMDIMLERDAGGHR